jgi:hypothetical protein
MLDQLLRAILPTAILSALLLAIAWRPWRTYEGARGWWGSALALALGYAAADAAMSRGWPGLPPHEPSRWMTYIALAAGLVGVLEPWWRGKPWRFPAAAAFLAATFALLLSVKLKQRAAIPASLLRIAAFTAVGCLLWWALTRYARGHTGARLPLVLWASASGASAILLQSRDPTTALLVGGIAAGLGWFVILAWWRPTLAATRWAIPVFVAILTGQVMNASRYELPTVSAALALASPACVWLGDLPPLRRVPPWAGTLLCLAAVGLLTISALWWTPGRFDFNPE